MYIDLTIPLREEILKEGLSHGHIGTHLDKMDKVFPLEYSRRDAVVFDVRGKEEITPEDIDLSLVERNRAILFYSGLGTREEYGSDRYRHEHPVLSYELIDILIEKRISLILIDFAGVRRGGEHTPADQLLADHDIFVVENLCHLDLLPEGKILDLYTLPLLLIDTSASPCRVVAGFSERDPLSILGRRVSVTIDRPIGTPHPNHPDILYPLNYGFIPGLYSEDGEEQDAYVLGVDLPLEAYEGRVIAIIRRYDDVEDKWVVAPEGITYSIAEIREKTYFQEQFYHSEILLR